MRKINSFSNSNKVKPVLFKSNINVLTKVFNQLSYSQTMNNTFVILNEENRNKKIEAKNLISKAIQILNEII